MRVGVSQISLLCAQLQLYVIWLTKMCRVFFFFFFFQAEDGIRDLVRSRGLGDVYKRQMCTRMRAQRHPHIRPAARPGERNCLVAGCQTLYLSLIHI